MNANSLAKPSWKLRRRAVFGSMIFAMAIVVFTLFKWDDTSLAQTLVLSSFALIGTVVAAYIGGAAYEDVKTYQTDAESLPITEGEIDV
jgi:multisubunit Na+/H+ antiporter MnhG subunit